MADGKRRQEQKKQRAMKKSQKKARMEGGGTSDYAQRFAVRRSMCGGAENPLPKNLIIK